MSSVEIAKYVWHTLGAIAIGSTLSNAVLGGMLIIIRGWVPSEPDLRKRVDLLRDTLSEKVSQQLHLLITSAVTNLVPAELRSATAGKTDLVANCTDELFRVAHIMNMLDEIEATVCRCNTLLIVLLVAALCGVLLTFVIPILRPLFSAISIGTIAGQFAIVFVVRTRLANLSSYERAC